MPNLTFVQTADGSQTIFNPEVGENYHSRHGALQESRHVFVHSGLEHYLENSGLAKASILEVGFGTGLNFLLTADFSLEHRIAVEYTGIEAYPLQFDMISKTGYDQYISANTWDRFLSEYKASFDQPVGLSDHCMLNIAECKLEDFRSHQKFDVIYFDAFAAVHQPEMWTDEALAHVCSFLKPGGVFVTYAITGNLKRTMKALGFSIEKAPGAPGKREMLRATKNTVLV